MTHDDDRLLNPADGVKPLDFGADGTIGSLDANGRVVALNTYHPQHGFVTLTTADPFDETRRYDQAAVRAYRAGLTALRGFGPHFGQPVLQRQALLLDGALPHVRLTLASGDVVEVTTWAQDGGALQTWEHPGLAPRWRGRLSLQRCAYTQLTEGGPAPMPAVQTRAALANGVLTIENPALGWAAAIAGFAPGEAWENAADEPLALDIAGLPDATTLAWGFGPDAASAREAALRLAAQGSGRLLEHARAHWQAWRAGGALDDLAWRGLLYGWMMGVPVGETACILTDHMLLPLSWNRDAYYVARALLGWRAEGNDLVRRHLLWMFETAELYEGAWARCYLANGRVKDAAYQLDQQLFPLLELAEYARETGDWRTWERLRGRLGDVFNAVLARRADERWLFPTDETPADDPVALPYHLSSHILLWRVLRRMAQIEPDGAWAGMADAVRDEVQRSFIAPYQGAPIYAYAVDGAGRAHFYHDANDVPLALAPAWGFVPADDPVWRATVEFAFSPANVGGCYARRLGSVHTPAPWPLGDVQDLIIAQTLGDHGRARRAQARLAAAAQWDGALPEATSTDSMRVVSRHWFAWPNALLACVMRGVLALP
ncbi:MAG: glycoside hydrolase family 125 protein [Anaerolineae bacterium]|nr:glycoside hydrolase family 125 protein [Anaerolineae bacterium]